MLVWGALQLRVFGLVFTIEAFRVQGFSDVFRVWVWNLSAACASDVRMAFAKNYLRWSVRDAADDDDDDDHDHDHES